MPRGFPVAPLEWGDAQDWMRKIAEVANSLRDGKINPRGTVTLTANAASTTLSDKRISPDSVVLFFPRTANAAAEWANGTMYDAPGDQETVITHASNAQTDRTFGYAVLG